MTRDGRRMRSTVAAERLKPVDASEPFASVIRGLEDGHQPIRIVEGLLTLGQTPLAMKGVS